MKWLTMVFHRILKRRFDTGKAVRLTGALQAYELGYDLQWLIRAFPYAQSGDYVVIFDGTMTIVPALAFEKYFTFTEPEKIYEFASMKQTTSFWK